MQNYAHVVSVMLEPRTRAQASKQRQRPGTPGSLAPKCEKKKLMQNGYEKHEVIAIYCTFIWFSYQFRCFKTIVTSPVTFISDLLHIVLEGSESCPVDVLPVTMLCTRFGINYFLGHSPSGQTYRPGPDWPVRVWAWGWGWPLSSDVFGPHHTIPGPSF